MTDDVRIPVGCADCGHGDLRLDTGSELILVCPNCSREREPAPCPECGYEGLETTLGGTEVVVVCRGCGATLDRLPVQE